MSPPNDPFKPFALAGRLIFSNWQIAGIITRMSGFPIDIVDSNAGSFLFGQNKWAVGNVGRNVLGGPKQNDVDFLMSKRVPFGELRSIEFFNHFANAINNLNAFVHPY
ncbi:MAG TPA: hypothetical protein VJR02_01600 [Pyrinomonadaceae bacterium]|nr:hypothetical protein [Pyrinomonadaceae bacterium]